MESIYIWLIERYNLLIEAGRTIFVSGSVLICAGLWGKVVKTSISTILSLSPPPVSATRTLAEIYPVLPTWWIPESTAGFILAALVTCIGITVALIGKHLRRIAEF